MKTILVAIVAVVVTVASSCATLQPPPEASSQSEGPGPCTEYRVVQCSDLHCDAGVPIVVADRSFRTACRCVRSIEIVGEP